MDNYQLFNILGALKDIHINLNVSGRIEVAEAAGSPGFSLSIGPVSSTFEGDTNMATPIAVALTDSQKVHLTVTGAVDARGDATGAPVGALTWTSSDTTIATVTPDATDPLSADVFAVGALGAATITVTDGTGTATFDFTIGAGSESGFAVTVGTPTAQ